MEKLPNGHGGWVDAHDRQTDVDLEILDVLREGPKSAYRLAAALTRAGEVVGTDAVRERLRALASCGLVVSTASGHEAAGGQRLKAFAHGVGADQLPGTGERCGQPVGALGTLAQQIEDLEV